MMFKKAGTEQDAPKWDRVDTIIGKNTHINGTVTSTGVLRVDGKIEGQLIHRGDLIVGESGTVEATISVRHITIAGRVRGNVEAEGKIEIVSTGQLLGDVKSTGLIIADGAVFVGKSEMNPKNAPVDNGQLPVSEAAATRETKGTN